ncbi:ArsR family transcriptional regulator [Halobacteriales archaeon QS_1_69_70]|nr:MAG: ArsR family transcriptional regulator [Halobacteriales archaeon QS_1_69_70]
MSLLPSSPDVAPDSDPRLVGLDSEDADAIMAALSAETARLLLAELHDEPAPPGELADRVDTSLQNVQYHLEKLETAGAIEDVGTAYSEKGREMTVYGPADSPLVIYAGERERAAGLRAALTRLFTGIAALAVGSLAVQELFGRSVLQRAIEGATPSFGAPASETATPTATPEDREFAEGDGDAAGANGDGANVSQEGGTATPTDDSNLTVAGEDRAGNETEVTGTETGMAGNETAGTDSPEPKATSEPTETPLATDEGQTEAAAEQTPTPSDTPVPAAEDGGGGPLDVLDGLLDGLLAGGLPPGLAFFVGGLTVLLFVVGTTYVRARP